MGLSRKEITFDLSQEALKQHYPRKENVQDPQFFKRAYKDIQRFMDANGFDRQQYSVYVSRSELTALDVAVLTRQMAEQLPWLRLCVKDITATNIGARHSLLGLLRDDAQPNVSLEKRMDTRPSAFLSQDRTAPNGWSFYIIADLKTWADNAENRSPLERYSSFEEAKTRFEELRGESYNSEAAEPGPDGQPPARLTLGLESADGMSAADILHVRQGKNYLVTDFTRSEQLRDDPVVMDILARVSREIGFDCVRVYEQHGDRVQLLPNVPFAEWDNPHFSAATPGRIAAQYYSFLHECYPLPKDNELRAGQIREIVQFVQREGKAGVSQLKLAVAALAASFSDNAAVQKLAKSLTEELTQYNGLGQAGVQRQKPQRKKAQER